MNNKPLILTTLPPMVFADDNGHTMPDIQHRKTMKIFFATVGILIIGLAQPSLSHAHGDEHHHDVSTEYKMAPAPGAFLVKKEIDGYQGSFHVMKVPEGMQKHGGAYHFMFKAEKNGKVLTNILVNSKVTHPNGQSESKMMMRTGGWYMADYNLGHPGVHQIMVLFKTSDGKKHSGSIEYQAQDTVK